VKRPTDPARFVEQLFPDDEGMICEQSVCYLNKDRMQEEAL